MSDTFHTFYASSRLKLRCIQYVRYVRLLRKTYLKLRLKNKMKGRKRNICNL